MDCDLETIVKTSKPDFLKFDEVHGTTCIQYLPFEDSDNDLVIKLTPSYYFKNEKKRFIVVIRAPGLSSQDVSTKCRKMEESDICILVVHGSSTNDTQKKIYKYPEFYQIVFLPPDVRMDTEKMYYDNGLFVFSYSKT